ncbi:hypothetical protein [Campylobacter suis]|uniref:Tetratricopeptide repeat protein n=1 Tax=Campylobacter suis TaxID=2790657 RepID=A0ABN7KBE0_9BACT|nr:hypothetical protein [Campylobacter suis]CAD7288142.1 hypothetical protein LMG8286_01158 [Campylobacter suis]
MITLHTHSLSSYKRDSNEVFAEFDDRFEIVFFSAERLENLEESLYKKLTFYRSLGLVYGVLSGLGVFLVLFAIGAINIYEGFFEDILLKREFSLDYEGMIGLLATAFLLIVVTLLPSLSGGESNAVANVLKSWFNAEARRKNRLKYALSKLHTKPLHIYSPDTLSYEEMGLLFGALNSLKQTKFNVILHIRNEGLGALKQILNYNGEVVRENSELNAEKIVKLLDKSELAMLELASFASVKNEKTNILAIDLLEILATNLLSHSDQIGAFLHRGFNEYALLKNKFQGYSELVFSVKVDERLRGKAEFFIRANLENIVSKLHEPLGIYWLLERAIDYEMLHKRQIWLLKTLINTALNANSFRVFALPILKDGLKFESLNSEFSTSMLKSLDILALQSLLECLKRAGRFEDALIINKYLSPINPCKYALLEAILLERMGKFDNALNTMKGIEIIKLNAADEALFYERFAWLFVSARFDLEQENGLKALEKLKEILDKNNELATPCRIWNLNNIIANYHEWMNDLENALKFHEKAMKFPAISESEYAASLLNYSIVLRLIFLRDGDAKNLHNALKYAQNAQNFKQNLGDLDESPIVLHNIALHIFYGIVSGVFETHMAEQMQSYAKRALAVIEATNSSKKLAVILAENIAAKKLLNIDTTELEKRLKMLDTTSDLAIIDDMKMRFKKFAKKELL